MINRIRIAALLMTVILLFSLCVFAQNPYGLSDESTQFLKEHDVDFSVFETKKDVR